MGSLAGDVRNAARARDRDGQRQERDEPEDRGGAAPAQRLKEQTCGEERERAAEVERGDVEADRAAAARGLRVLRDEAHAGHVDAGQAEPREHAKHRGGEDVVGAEGEREVRERCDERADRDDARGRDAIGER